MKYVCMYVCTSPAHYVLLITTQKLHSSHYITATLTYSLHPSMSEHLLEHLVFELFFLDGTTLHRTNTKLLAK
jgi:hypothetical protein